MNKVLLPPVIVDAKGPVIFLAGPIQGAPDWHEEAARILLELDPALTVASPRALPNEYETFDEAHYNAQVDWETHFLRRAAREGAIMFWLAKEKEHIHERAYAQTSRFEIGEWKERHLRDGVRLAVGIEEGFSGARYIRRRFGQDCPKVPIVSSLREACEAAARLART